MMSRSVDLGLYKIGCQSMRISAGTRLKLELCRTGNSWVGGLPSEPRPLTAAGHELLHWCWEIPHDHNCTLLYYKIMVMCDRWTYSNHYQMFRAPTLPWFYTNLLLNYGDVGSLTFTELISRVMGSLYGQWVTDDVTSKKYKALSSVFLSCSQGWQSTVC